MREIAKVTILSKKELNEKNPMEGNSIDQITTRRAIEKGYSIAVVEKKGLHEVSDIVSEIEVALDKNMTEKVNFCGITDLSELKTHDRVYCSFK